LCIQLLTKYWWLLLLVASILLDIWFIWCTRLHLCELNQLPVLCQWSFTSYFWQTDMIYWCSGDFCASCAISGWKPTYVGTSCDAWTPWSDDRLLWLTFVCGWVVVVTLAVLGCYLWLPLPFSVGFCAILLVVIYGLPV
jgi:hypothetical protein